MRAQRENNMEKFMEYIGAISDPIDRARAYDEAYKARKIPRQEVRRARDVDGNLIREKAMVYYGESFEEAKAREANEGTKEK